jgi:AbrB family looped-hinge helix DNA binding protein
MVLSWYRGLMRVTMDQAGRIVIPKSIREQLGLKSDDEFDAVIDGLAIRLQPRMVSVRRIRDVEGWPVLEAVPGQPLTDDDVQRLRDGDQR